MHRAGVIVFLLLACLDPGIARAAARPQAASQKEDLRETLASPSSDPNDRTRAALALFASDPGFLRDQLLASRDEHVLSAILDAIAISATPSRSGAELTEAIVALLRSGERTEVYGQAMRALRAMDRADASVATPEERRVRDRLYAELDGRDPARLRAAAIALADLGDLQAIPRMLAVLDRTRGEGPLARAAGAGLERMLMRPFGTDARRWREYWAQFEGKFASYHELLRALLEREREASEKEILRLKVELDEDNPQALIADLQYALPSVRKFAAETLARRVPDPTIAQAACDSAITALLQESLPAEVEVAFLALMQAADESLKRTGDEPLRDQVLERCLGDADGKVVAAAARAAAKHPVARVKAAMERAVAGLTFDSLDPEGRTALLETCGSLALTSAAPSAVRLLGGDPAVEVRVAAAAALAQVGDASAADALAQALKSDANWRVRRQAASALAAVAKEDAVPALIAALEDARPEVRSDCAAALSAFHRPDVVAALIARLDHEDTIVTDVVRALGKLGDPAALEPLCAAAARVPKSNGKAQADPAAEQFRLALREALEAVAGKDLGQWSRVAVLFGNLDRRALLAWAEGMRVKLIKEKGGDGLQEARLRQAEAALLAQDFAMVDQVAGEALEDKADGASLLRFQQLRARGALELARLSEAAQLYDLLLASPQISAEDRVRLTFESARVQDRLGGYERVSALLHGMPALDVPSLILLARAERKLAQPAAALRRLDELLKTPLDASCPSCPAWVRLEIGLERAEALLDLDRAEEAKLVGFPPDAEIPADTPTELRERLQSVRDRLGLSAPAPPSSTGPAAKGGARRGGS